MRLNWKIHHTTIASIILMYLFFIAFWTVYDKPVSKPIRHIFNSFIFRLFLITIILLTAYWSNIILASLLGMAYLMTSNLIDYQNMKEGYISKNYSPPDTPVGKAYS